MILDILVFTLGFLVAGLLALAALPAVWRRAMRLSGERLSRLVPLSPEEIAADRDHLRAAHAVELRRTEQQLERAGAARADLMAEASRREDRIAALTQEGARSEVAIAALTAAAAQGRRDLDELLAERGTAMVALHDASGLADKRWAEAVDLRLENQRLADQVERDRASLAALETRVLGATTRADDLARDLALARDKAAATAVAPAGEAEPGDREPDPSVTAAAETAARALEQAQRRQLDQARRRELEHLTHEVEFAHQQAASAERRATEAARETERMRAERDALAAEIMELKATPEPAPGDDHDRLRAAIAALAEDVMRIGAPASSS